MKHQTRKGVIGTKVGMTHVYLKNGKQVPVTVVHVEPNLVTQVKHKDKDGYAAVQLAIGSNKLHRINNATKGKFKKLNKEPRTTLREIRTENAHTEGDLIDVTTFEVGDLVDVSALTKGRGFTGAIKRWNQSRGPMGHGSGYHRGVGSMGAKNHNRIFKGKNMPGQYGVENVTTQNLEVIEVNKEDSYILVKGAIPGPKKTVVVIKNSIKKLKVKHPHSGIVGVE